MYSNSDIAIVTPPSELDHPEWGGGDKQLVILCVWERGCWQDGRLSRFKCSWYITQSILLNSESPPLSQPLDQCPELGLPHICAILSLSQYPECYHPIACISLSPCRGHRSIVNGVGMYVRLVQDVVEVAKAKTYVKMCLKHKQELLQWCNNAQTGASY